MPAITIADLNNAKTDVDHIADIATSLNLTATDRLGHVKDTMTGAVYKITQFTDRGAWAGPGTAYSVKDLVSESGTWYVAVVAHTSGATFAGDVAAKWRVYQGVIAGDLAAPTGSGGVGYAQSGALSVSRSVQDRLRDHRMVKDWGVVGDGVTNDLPALIKLFADAPTNNFTVDFQNLPIYLGGMSARQVPLFLFSNRRGIRFINPGLIIVDNNLTDPTYPQWASVFQFNDCAMLDLDVNIQCSPTLIQPGLICGVEIQTSTGATNQVGYSIRSRMVNGHAPLLVGRAPADHIAPNAPLTNPTYASDFQVDLYGDQVNYGGIFNYNGTQVTGDIQTLNAVRSYFSIDTHDHNVRVQSKGHTTFTDVLIKSYWADVSNIVVDYEGVGDVSTTGSILTLEFENNAQNTAMTNIHARIVSDKAASSLIPPPVIISRQYNAGGSLQTVTNSRTHNISLDLHVNQESSQGAIKVDARPALSGNVTLLGKPVSVIKSNGLSFIRGGTYLSNNTGPYSGIPSGYLYFYLESLAGEQSAYCELEALAQVTSASLGAAYLKVYFTASVSSSGTITTSALTTINQYLLGVAGGPAVVLSNPSPFLIIAAFTGGTWNGATAQLKGKLRVIGPGM